MKKLQHLLSALPDELAPEVIQGNTETKIVQITADSREAGPGSLFVAVKGTKADGHTFLPQVADQGCCCVVVEEEPGSLPELSGVLPGVTVIRVRDSHAAPGLLAAALYDFPAEAMTMIGLTGTNGKTTVSWLTEKMLQSCGCRVGVIGTVNYRYPDRSGRPVIKLAPLTTPGPIALQQLLRDMADQGVTHVIMETSSHALLQERLAGIRFAVGVFTNLSRDHLDFHGSMEAYFAAKKLLFTRFLKQDGQAVLVTDSGEKEAPEGRTKSWGRQLGQELAQEHPGIFRITCALKPASPQQTDLYAENLKQDIHGFACDLVLSGSRLPFRSALTGKYNVLNALAAAGVGLALRMQPEQIVAGLQEVGQVPGRLQRVALTGAALAEQPCVLVDYAHTPDALHNVLQTLKPLASGRLICVFGCGGDRDQGKRPLMGAAAAGFADIIVVTSDNPRSEEPGDILRQVAEGVRSAGAAEVAVAELFGSQAVNYPSHPCFCSIEDRRTAIYTACSLAGPKDIVLLAGKGHEDYQIIGQQRLFFDDRLEALNGLLHWNIPHLLQALRALPGSKIIGKGRQHGLLGQISTDTRTLTKGDIFVALVGEKFDGHNYVRTAADAGAAVLIVQHMPKEPQLPEDVAVLQVQDTLQALGELAAYRRRLLHRDVQVVAITGSCGKTTVKEMTAAIFNRHYAQTQNSTGIDPVLKTGGNFNNLIGLPLSLLPVEAGHKVAVMEMGMNRFGEIKRLTEIADPDIACITNVQAAHLEGLGSIAGVAQAKGELFAGMRQDTATVVNYDDPQVRRLKKRSGTVIGFACTPAGRRHKPAVRATRIADCGAAGMRFTLHIEAWQQRISVQAPGTHTVSNCLATAALAHAAGVPPDTVVAGLQAYQGADKRMQLTTLPGGVQVLNDCYNANPGSMAAALRTVSGFGDKRRTCRRIAVLGDMLELGQEAEIAHTEVGRLAAELGYDQLAVTGNFAGQVVQGACRAGMPENTVHVFPDTRALADWLYTEMIQARVTADDWLLLKGSRGMRMEAVLQEIERRFATGIRKEGDR
ncbi:MAG: UDP-N-acetylmuramoyl-L-alanyl-D-glutamate--2,6-diaminopimelate ligase [Candidatus Electrothrix sp. YB6]